MCLYISLFTFKFLNKEELAQPKKLQLIELQRKTPENKFARDLSNDFREWTLIETLYINIGFLLLVKQHVVLFVLK